MNNTYCQYKAFFCLRVVVSVLFFLIFFDGEGEGMKSAEAASGGDGQMARKLSLADLAVSPNGDVIAFQYNSGPNLSNPAIALLEWRTGKLTRIPNPSDSWLSSPSFSNDGKKIAVSITKDHISSEIAIVDLSTMHVSQVTNSESEVRFNKPRRRVKFDPIFSNDDNSIVYLEYDVLVSNRRHISIVNVADGKESSVIDESHGFYSIFKPFFSSSGEIYFNAEGPADALLKSKVNSLWEKNSEFNELSYKVKIGDGADLLFPDFQVKMKGKGHLSNIHSLAGAENAKIIVFSSAIDPNTKGLYEHEIYKYDNGSAIQLTNIKSFIHYVRISRSGDVVAFLEDPTRHKNFDISIFDARDGRIREANLLTELASNPDFLNN